MRNAFEKDFGIKWDGADGKLQLGYMKGFAAAKQPIVVDFDPTKAPSMRDQALQQFKATVEPML